MTELSKKNYDIIINKHNVDTQGFYEYMKLTIEKEQIETEKVWRKIDEGGEKRYTRCLTFDYDGQTYLADSVCKTLNSINKNDLDKELFVFNPEKNEYSYYGG